MLVHVVGHDPDAGMLHQNVGDGLQFAARIGRAGRVRRRAQDDPLGLRRDRLLQRVGLQLEALRRRAHHRHRLAPGERHHFRIAHPIGRRDDHLVARIDGGHQRVVEHLLAAGANNDLVRLVGEAVLALELGGDRLLQFGKAVDRGVLGLAGLDGADRRQLDVGRGVEVGLAGAEADDVAALRFQRACFVRYRHGRGRLHTVKRSGQKRHHRLLANVVNRQSTTRIVGIVAP